MLKSLPSGKNPANKDKFITTGLWARQQHPKDLGETLLWFGIAVVAIPVLSPAAFGSPWSVRSS